MTGTSEVVTREVVSPDGARVHVLDHRTTGDGDLPTLVLAHGWTLDQSSWARVVSALQQRHLVRVVTYDQPGHGLSTLGRGRRATVRDLGETLRAVIGEVVPDGPLVLGGHSMGGMTVMAYAGAHPDELHERARGVLLMATTPELASLRRPIRGEGVVMGLQAVLPSGVPSLPMSRDMVRRATFGADEPDPRDLAHVMSMGRATSARATGRYFSALQGHDELGSLRVFDGIPTVVLAGERDRLTPARWSRMYHERIPGAALDVVPRAGHMLAYEATDRVVEHLEDLLLGRPLRSSPTP